MDPMQHLIMAITMAEHMADAERNSETTRHAATARELRRSESRRPNPEAPAPKSYFNFLPRFTGYPTSR
jgi:hypothetical protein